MDSIYSYYWFADDVLSDDDGTYIRIYGVRENGRTVCLRVNDFTPYFYVLIRNARERYEVERQLKVGGAYCTGVKDYKQLKKRSLYDGSKEFDYFYVRCASKSAIAKLMWRLRNKTDLTEDVKCFEHQASPILQLTSLLDVPPIGWIRFNRTRLVADVCRETNCDEEYVVRWRDLRPDDPTVTRRVFTPKMMAFDIEVNSEIVSAFPSNKPDDTIFLISCVVRECGDDDAYRKILLTLPGTDLDVLDDKELDVRVFENEELLLRGFIDTLLTEKPQILVGYNILGFDISYVLKRCDRYLLTENLRTAGYNAVTPAKIVEPSPNSTTQYWYVDWEGIIIMDMYPIMKKDYKFDNYKLETVCSNLLGVGKDPVTHKDIFESYRTRKLAVVAEYCVRDSLLCLELVRRTNCWVALSEMAKVCNVSVFALYAAGQQLKIYSQVYKYCLRQNIVVDGGDCRGASRDVPHEADEERYVGAHVIEPVPGYYERVVPLDFSSLYPSIIIAYNICYSTIVANDSVSTYSPSEINVFEWEDHIGCVHDEKVIARDNLTTRIENVERSIKELMKKRDAINAKNVDLGVRVCDAKRVVQIEIEKLRAIQAPIRKERQERFGVSGRLSDKPICAKRKYAFVKKEVRAGVIPTIITNLLDSRKRIKAAMKDPTVRSDATAMTVLDKQQLAYKISANSMYGAMGVKFGYLPFMPGAMCVTYVGRTAIEKAAESVRDEWGGRIVYGDTDSNYVIFPKEVYLLADASGTSNASDHNTEIAALWDYAVRVADSISSRHFPKPMKLEFEQAIYERFFILSKKRYMFQKIDRDGVLDKEIGKKGVVLARRDNSNALRRCYEMVASMIFDRVPKDDILYALVEFVNDMYRDVVDREDYVVTKSIKDMKSMNEEGDEFGATGKRLGDYKVPDSCRDREEAVNSCPAHVRLADRMSKRGTPVDSGSRIEYVVIERDGVIGAKGKSSARVGDRVEDYDYFKSRSRYIKIDKDYYLTSFINPIDQMLKVGVGESGFLEEQLRIRRNYRRVVDEIYRLTF